MSIVTSIIIIFPYSEDERDRIEEINSFTFEDRKFYFHWIDQNTTADNQSDCYSGNKVFNSVLLLASYNKFPTEPFLKHLSSKVNWLDIDAVQVLLNSEDTNDKTFQIYSDAGKTLVCNSLKI